jgi:autotransporter-associated beta strand protein
MASIGGFGTVTRRARSRRGAILLAGTFLAGLGLAGPTAAQDAAWIGNGTPTGSWNNAANWNPGIPLDTATFNANPTTTVTFSAATTIDTMQFNLGASAYTFNLSGQSLEITAAAFGPGIVNNSGQPQTFNTNGLLQFSNGATAGDAIINNTPGATTFTGFSTAGTATITNSGGGLTSFTDSSNAGSATITTNGGSLTQFVAFSDGANARFITNAGGTVDFSGTSGADGLNQISAGSIEGAGTYFLGKNQLTVGGNNLSTVVSGTINDGGGSGGTGASLIKVGAGTLTLSGVNTYSGTTIVADGTLLLAGSGTLGASTAQLQVTGGTLDLGGTTQTTGAMTIFDGQIINGTLNSTSYDLQNGLVSATLTGGAVTKDGVGTVTLTSANSYSGGTTINDGTLLLAGAGTLGAITGQLQVNGGTLDLGGTTQTTGAMTMVDGQAINGTLNSTSYNLQNGLVSATLTGGAVTKDGVGTVTVTGVNSYSGGTTINDGVLIITNGGALSTGGIVMNGGTLTASQSFTLNNSVIFNNAAVSALTAAAGQTLTLTGLVAFFPGSVTTFGSPTDTGTIVFNPSATAQSPTAAVVVGGGTLSAASNGLGNVLAVTQSTTVNAGATLAFNDFFAGIRNLNGAGSVVIGVNPLSTLALTVDAATTQEFSGVISGAGKVDVSGAGTMILSGNNTYAGGTTVSAGATLQLGNGGAAGSVLGNILNNGTLVFNRADTFSFAGVVSGGGDLIQAGPGTTVLSNTNTYTGATTVNAGTLQVDGSIVSSSGVTVNAGGTLAGIGIVSSTTIGAGANLAPGPAGGIGTLTIQGTLVMNTAAAYLIQISGSSASKTNVSGAATLGGTVQISGSGAAGTYLILNATGGLGGTTFSGVSGSVTGTRNPHLTYDANDVFLVLDPGALTLPSGLAQNQQNVGNAINNFVNNGGTLPPAFQPLLGASGGNLAAALTLLSGEAATGGQQGAFQLTNQFLGLMLDPFAGGGAGFGGAFEGSATGFAPERALLPDDIALAYAKVTKAPAPNALTFAQRWTVWGAAYGGYNRTNGDPAVVGSHDLTSRAGGFAAGMDYRLTGDTVVGFALAGAGTSWGLAQGLGGGRSDAFQAGVYGATRAGPLYVAAALAATNYWMSTDRFAPAGDHLAASFGAQSFGARVETGYRVRTPVGAVTPYAALQAQNFHTPGYNETDLNNGGFGLAFNARNATDTRSELGARFDRQIMVDHNSVLALRAKLAWAHDWVSDPSLAPVFQALPGASFIVNGATPAKDSALAAAGTELRMANGVSLIGKFDGEFNNRSQTYAGTGTLRYAW